MKKSYLEPETTIIKMRHALLMVSGEAKSINNNAGLDYKGGGDGEARSRGIWDRWDD